jgi:hypothetical protein
VKHFAAGAAWFLNATLSIYAPSFITTSLLLHRQMIKVCLGDKADTAHHIHLINIFMESAAINVPISICIGIGVAMEKLWGEILAVPGIASQVSQIPSYFALLYTSGRGIEVFTDLVDRHWRWC